MRKVITILAALAAFYFVPFLLIILPGESPSFIVRLLVGIVAAASAAWYAWTHFDSMHNGLAGLGSSMMMGAIVVGTIGFLGGFIGPMVFAPDANQGPLLGIFITGPLGFLLGAIGGGVRWFWLRPNRTP